MGIAVLQLERPFHDPRNYVACLETFKDISSHLAAARLAFRHFAHAHHGDHTPLQRFRHETSQANAKLLSDTALLVESMQGLPSGDAAEFLQQREIVKQSMAAMKERVTVVRQQVFMSLPVIPVGGAGFLKESHVELSATYFHLLEVISACERLTSDALTPATLVFLPWSLGYVKKVLANWLLSWSPTTAKINPYGANYIQSRGLAVRLLSALTVSVAVVISLLFSMVPVLTAQFSRGSWVSLTCIFVYNNNGGATLRAARDRFIGIFVGASYAFVVILILRGDVTSQTVLQEGDFLGDGRSGCAHCSLHSVWAVESL